MDVPEFKQYFATISSMDFKQRSFYEYWLSQWKNGKIVPVNGQISYLFCYLYSVLELPTNELIDILNRMISAYPEEKHIVLYCKWWLSDCHVLLGDFAVAIKVIQGILINNQTIFSANELLSLKLLAKQRISGYDVLTLNGLKLTAFGKKNIEGISKYLEIFIRSKEESENINILEQWKIGASVSKYSIFNGSFKQHFIDIPRYSFSENPKVIDTIISLSREAENTVREEMGIPKVGEGWVSETELYYKIKGYFPNIEVINHARPDWINRQHLDIFIPSLKIAIEYQGSQHFKPIEYFGGEKGYQATLKRDSLKRRRCKANGYPINICS